MGVIVALVVFSFSGTGRNSPSKWVEGVGTVVKAYTISEAENKEEAGIYVDIQFVDSTGETRTERSTELKTEMSSYVGKNVEIKYNPKGTGVLVTGNEKNTGLKWTQVVFIIVAIFVIFAIGELIKRNLPTPEEYAQRRKKGRR